MRGPIVLVASLLLCGPASAQPSGDPQRTAAAQALFAKAGDLMKSGDAAAACPKLEEALRLEPSAVGGRLKLAECYEQTGRLASAWGAYSVAEAGARSAGQVERQTLARDKAAALLPRLSTLTLRPPRGAADVVVERDGLAVGEGQLGSPVPVDGGAHRCAAYSGGKEYWEASVVVKTEGDAVVVDVPAPPPAAAAAPPPSPPPPVAPPPPVPAPTRGGEVPVWAWIVGGASLGVAAVGVGLRVDAADVESRQAAACGPALDQCPPSFDVAGTNRHKQDSFAAFVALEVVGGLGLGAAIVGAAVGASRPRSSPGRARLLLPTLALSQTTWAMGAAGEW